MLSSTPILPATARRAGSVPTGPTLESLLEAGCNYCQIARTLGISYPQVESRVRLMIADQIQQSNFASEEPRQRRLETLVPKHCARS